MIGEVVSHYRIVAKLGQGGMGAVYRADDLSLGRPVALKFLSTTSGASAADKEVERARLLREAQAAAALDHPGICTVYEIGEHDGQVFIAMALVEGRNLREMILSDPPSVEQSLNLTLQIAQALGAAHDKGIVHRDIKSGNIMIGQDGLARIVDFGLAKRAGGEGITQAGMTVGTCATMSPEQTRGEPVDARTDIWSLGVVLYEMLTGRLPFRGGYDQAVLYAVLHEDPAPPSTLRPEVTPQIDRIVMRCLAKDPESRYGRMSELAADLTRQRQGHVRQWLDRWRSIERARGRRLGWLAAAAVLLTAAVFVGGQLARSSSRPIRFAERDWLLIGDFADRTGDNVWPQLIRAALLLDLEQSRYVNVITGRRLTEALQRMGRDASARIDSTLGRQLAVREGVRAILEGSIVPVGQGFEMEARLVSPVTGAGTRPVRVRAASRERMLDALDELARSVRRGLGESMQSIRRSDEPLAKVSTASLTALQAYTRGSVSLDRGDWQDAILRFKEAVAADSTFAMAYVKLG